MHTVFRYAERWGAQPAYSRSDHLRPVGGAHGRPAESAAWPPFTAEGPGCQRRARASLVTQLVYSEVRPCDSLRVPTEPQCPQHLMQGAGAVSEGYCALKTPSLTIRPVTQAA